MSFEKKKRYLVIVPDPLDYDVHNRISFNVI